ncbi:hypothetical protein OAF27_01025 [Verrucomicrobiales bacterium]|nr:hypothetical protein [Verrucomicrobiales bacterium]
MAAVSLHSKEIEVYEGELSFNIVNSSTPRIMVYVTTTDGEISAIRTITGPENEPYEEQFKCLHGRLVQYRRKASSDDTMTVDLAAAPKSEEKRKILTMFEVLVRHFNLKGNYQKIDAKR